MARNPNTTVLNESFDQDTINSVWNKAIIVENYDSSIYRKDKCGAWIKKSDHGDTNSKYGWEIDHEKPVAKGGTDGLSNLQPLHWSNNRGKSDDWPNWYCTKTS